MKPVVLSWYNRGGRAFPKDNGVRWFRVHVRLWRWLEIGGLWWSVPPAKRRVRVLWRQKDGPQKPPSESTPLRDAVDEWAQLGPREEAR